MKAERRHELKENVLAKDLGKAGEFIKRNANHILAVLAGIIVLIAVAVYIHTSRQNAARSQWQDYQRFVLQIGQQPEQLSVLRGNFLSLAQKTSQDELAGWAYLKAGEIAYLELMRGLPTLSQSDRDRLTGDAHDAFSEVVDSYSDHPARVNAFLGLGLLAETRGDFAEARRLYDQANQAGGEKAQLIAFQSRVRLETLDRISEPVALAPGLPPGSEQQEPQPETAPSTAPAETQPTTTES